jgi:hypothetical protein
MDNSDVPDARMRRSARWALGAGVLATFIIGLIYNSGDWALSFVHALLLMVVVVVGARVALGRIIWKLLF